MKNKKGSHVGIVISFTLFITALIIIFTVVGSPIKEGLDKRTSLEFLKSNVIKNIEKDVIVLRANYAGDPAFCAEVETPDNDFTSVNFIATNLDGNEIGSSISGGYTIFDGSYENVKILYSEDAFSKTLNEPDSGCTLAEIKSILEKRRILESEILDLINLVDTDYDSTKTLLEVNVDDEYNILFEYDDGTRIGEENREMGKKTNIYAKEYNIDFLNQKGEEKAGTLILKVW